jgi:hypothetical protein
MNKSVLLDIFAHARLRAVRRDLLISHQRDVIANLEKEGADIAETERLLSVLADARERDLVEMDWALDELDKTQRQAIG